MKRFCLCTSCESRSSKLSMVISATMTDEAVLNSLCIRKSIESGQYKNEKIDKTSHIDDLAITCVSLRKKVYIMGNFCKT